MKKQLIASFQYTCTEFPEYGDGNLQLSNEVQSLKLFPP